MSWNAIGVRPSRRHSAALEVCGVGGLLLVALILRCIRLDSSLWEDEVLTYRGANQPLVDVFMHRTQFLYYVLAHFALKISDTEAMLRLPSVLAGVAGVAAMYGFTRKLAGRRVAFVAAFALALSPYHVEKSQEARFYAFVMLADILLVWSLWRATKGGHWKALAAFAAAANLGIASQFTVAPYVVVLAIAAVIWIASIARDLSPKQRTKRILHLAMAALLGLSCLGASINARGTFPFVIAGETHQLVGTEEGIANVGDAGTYVSTYRLHLRQYLGILYDYVPRHGTWIGLVFLLLIIAGAAVLVRRQRLVAYLIAVQFILVPLPLFFLDVKHWYHERYFSAVYPNYALFIAVGGIFPIEQCTRLGLRGISFRRWDAQRLRMLVSTILIVIFMVGYARVSYTQLIHQYEYGRLNDWKTVTRCLATQLAPGDTIGLALPSAYATRQLPKHQQVFSSTHVALEFYLPRALSAANPANGAISADAVHIVAAGTKKQIARLRSDARKGNVYIIVEDYREADRAPDEDLERLPTVDLIRAPGLTLRKLVSPDEPIGQ